jgi:threonine aldolase
MIDLRSDTVTLPTPKMLEAMVSAKLGDDMRERDPTVVELEELAAEKTGKEASLFVASGTMGNLVAMLAHTGRGGEVLADARSHLLRSEIGGISQVAGLSYRHFSTIGGAPDLAALEPMLREKLTPGSLATALVSVETPHNDAGGTVVSLATLTSLRKMTSERNIPVHIDGARLFNAAVALHVPASEISRHADSITFCISKGLSAPVGSLLCGDKDFIERARLFRRMLGGAMRQSGVVAAAGVVALQDMVDRLKEDHQHAREIAEGLHRLSPRFVVLDSVETNILMVDVGHTSLSVQTWVSEMRSRGVDLRSYGGTRLRLLTHRHIDDEAVAAIVAAFSDIYRSVA